MRIIFSTFFFSVLAILIANSESTASHLKGGKISLSHIGGSSYNLEAEFYMDNANWTSQTILTAKIYEWNQAKENWYKSESLYPNPPQSNLPTQLWDGMEHFLLYQNQIIGDECNVNKKKLYSNIISLPSNVYNDPEGYWIEIELYEREQSTNTNSTQEHIMIGYWFDPAYVSTNSSPSIDMPNMSSKVEIGDNFFHNFNPTDAEGDQVTFSFYRPMTVHLHNDLLTWNNQYSTSQPFGTGSVTTLRNDGILKFIPYLAGDHIYGIKMNEYRGGNKISSTWIDLWTEVGQGQSNPFNFIPTPVNGQSNICQSDPNQLLTTDLSHPNTNYQYYWYKGSFLNPIQEWTTSSLVQPAPGAYNLIVKNYNRLGSGNAPANECGFEEKTVSFDYAPQYSVPNISSFGTLLCDPDQNFITVHNLSPNLEYRLYKIGGLQPVSGPYTTNLNSMTITIPSSGIYYVKGLDPQHPGACDYTSNQLPLTIKPYNSISLNFPPSIYFCENDIINITNNIPANAPGVAYNYQFTGGAVNTNANNTYFDLVASVPGWQTFTINAIGQNGCRFTETYDFYITPTACCKPGLQLLDQAVINTGQTNFTGNFHVTESIILNPNTYYVFDGKFYFQSEVIDFPVIDMPSISLRTGTVLQIEPNSKLTAYCDIMWEGIKLNNGTLIMNETEISHALIGIDGSHSAMKVYLQENVFYNNLKGISGEGISSGLFNLAFQISNNEFSTHSGDMLYPYNINGGYSNDYITDVGVNILGNSGILNRHTFFGNQFNKLMIGINFEDAISGYEIVDNSFASNKIAGIVIEDGDISISDNNFHIPLNQNQNLVQINDYYQNNSYANDGVFGILAFDGVDLSATENHFSNDNGYSDPELSQSVGIKYSLNTQSQAISDNVFNTLKHGLQVEGQGKTDILYNIFNSNHKGILINAGAVLNDIEFHCNIFQNDDWIIDYLNYGLFIDKNSTINTSFGGINMTPQYPNDLSGNYFPVDLDNSPGYPFVTNGDPDHPDVENTWNAPENWYAIYDDHAQKDNSNLGYYYFAYFNEFVGEKSSKPLSDAVFPTTIVFREDGTNIPNAYLADPFTCPNNPAITFPQERQLLNLKQTKSKRIKIVPNPINEYFQIFTNEPLNFKVLDLYNLQGKLMRSFTPNQTNHYFFSQIRKGVYYFKITESNGDYSTHKVLIEN